MTAGIPAYEARLKTTTKITRIYVSCAPTTLQHDTNARATTMQPPTSLEPTLDFLKQNLASRGWHHILRVPARDDAKRNRPSQA